MITDVCRHESARGFYRVSVYFLSKILCDFLPVRFVPLCLFSAIAYFMIGQFQPRYVLKAIRLFGYFYFFFFCLFIFP